MKRRQEEQRESDAADLKLRRAAVPRKRRARRRRAHAHCEQRPLQRQARARLKKRAFHVRSRRIAHSLARSLVLTTKTASANARVYTRLFVALACTYLDIYDSTVSHHAILNGK